MDKLIENFPQQIEQALEIGSSHTFKIGKVKIDNIVICGLGGSGIGASFLNDMVIGEISVPITTVKSYFLPKFVKENTLVIISSYSGNTEETVNCFEEAIKRKASICAVSSNGKVAEISKNNGIDCIALPGGLPPRACFAYSTIQLFFILKHFGFLSDSFVKDFIAGKEAILAKKDAIKKEAKELANSLFDKIPVLYSSNAMEAMTLRWRQQINENGKQLCWHNVVPEMNHNELVGWRQENQKLGIVFLRNETDDARIQKRMNLNKVVYQKYTSTIFEVWSQGNSPIERAIYLNHIGDWFTFYLSQLRGFDTVEVDVIDELKANLA